VNEAASTTLARISGLCRLLSLWVSQPCR
jgi:hypothetical protein